MTKEFALNIITLDKIDHTFQKMCSEHSDIRVEIFEFFQFSMFSRLPSAHMQKRCDVTSTSFAYKKDVSAMRPVWRIGNIQVFPL